MYDLYNDQIITLYGCSIKLYDENEVIKRVEMTNDAADDAVINLLTLIRLVRGEFRGVLTAINVDSAKFRGC